MAVGVTGHRRNNGSVVANEERIARVVDMLLNAVEEASRSRGSDFLANGEAMQFRLLTMLADGADAITERCAQARDWEICAPLPFGRALSAALLGSETAQADDIDALLAIGEAEPDRIAMLGAENAVDMLKRAEHARVLELAERDDEVIERWKTASRKRAESPEAWSRFMDLCSQRYALAARLVVEHADVLIAIWDGESRASAGGSGHTIEVALNDGVPVIWVNPSDPDNWRILTARAELGMAHAGRAVTPDLSAVSNLVASVIAPGDPSRAEDGKASRGLSAFRRVRHRRFGSLMWSSYRWLEWAFGGAPDGRRTAVFPVFPNPDTYGSKQLGPTYEKARELLAGDVGFVDRLEVVTSRRFALADGAATRLSDAYRGSMVFSFALAWLAVVAGALGGQIGDNDWIAIVADAVGSEAEGGVGGWPWIAFQLATIGGILLLTLAGRSVFGWHRRWLETRRVAEYLRHGHLLALLGVMRPLGRWPGAVGDLWPEWFARQTLREIGTPRVTITADYMRGVFEGIVLDHVRGQRGYHETKATRLQSVDKALERTGVWVFGSVFVVGAVFLVTTLTGYGAVLDAGLVGFFGVVAPMLAATLASVRFFCDFDRFAEISVATASRFRDIERDIEAMLSGDAAELDYEAASAALHRIDAAAVSELESWQAIFGQKGMMMPSYM